MWPDPDAGRGRMVPSARTSGPEPGRGARPDPDELEGRRSRRAADDPVSDARAASNRGPRRRVPRRAGTSHGAFREHGSSSFPETTTCSSPTLESFSTRWRSSSRACGRSRRPTASSRPSSSPISSARHTRATQLGDAAWAELLARHDAAVRAELDRYDGEEIDTAGDGFLALFDGPARAIRCGLAIRDSLARAGPRRPGRRPHGRGGAARRGEATRHRSPRRRYGSCRSRAPVRCSSAPRRTTSSRAQGSSSTIVASTCSRGSRVRAAGCTPSSARRGS